MARWPSKLLLPGPGGRREEGVGGTDALIWLQEKCNESISESGKADGLEADFWVTRRVS